MTLASRQKHWGIFKSVVVLLLIGCMVVLPHGTTAKADEEEIWYRGIVTNTVNVRTGPGQEYDRVVSGDEQFQLAPQDEVVIIGEAEASTGITWYQIRFLRGEEEIEGYATSSYIAKTDEVITPTPLPTPSPTPSPSPSPSPTPTTAPLIETPEPDTSPEHSKTLMLVIIAVLAVCLVLVIAFIIFRIRKTGKKQIEMNDTTRKVDSLKKLKLEEGKVKGAHKPVQIKRVEQDIVTEKVKGQEKVLSDTLVQRDLFDTLAAPAELTEELKETASKEAQEKRALREAIDSLKEHDIVMHKFFGEGEVYDNSDVKLMEVRFGNDVRFLNKDSLVAKRLLEIVDDEQMFVKRRSTRRPRRPRNDD